MAAVGACSEERPPSGAPPLQPSPASSGPDLDVPADAAVLVRIEDEGPRPFRQAGSAKAAVDESSLDGGGISVVERDGQPALRFPEFTASADYPRSILTVTNEGATDELSPGGGDFSYGVDFNLDDVSTGRTEDNGNNLIQRGLSSETALFKLEVDASLRPSCSVLGAAGEVTVRSSSPVLPGAWYRARCVRTGDRVDVSVAPIFSGSVSSALVRAKEGPIGNVDFAVRSIPVSIGGKVAENGQIIQSATDQFNGLMRNPYVVIDR